MEKLNDNRELPKVSIIIPCYNQAQYLPEAVGSVLDQTFTDYEIIIINDGSTDHTSDVAKSLMSNNTGKRIYLIEQENQGLAEARNSGIKKSKGQYILPLDADDTVHPEMLQKTVSLLDSEPAVAIAYTDIVHFGAVSQKINASEYDFRKLIHQNQLNYCSLFRKEAWREAGGYNPNMIWGYEDWDFWISCGEKGFYAERIPEFLFFYRVKESSMYTTALERDRELKALIVLNHPGLYTEKEVQEAKEVLDKYSRDLQLNKGGDNLYYFYSDKELDKNRRYVLLLGSFTGYQNFGDILQLKSAIDFHKKNSSLIPVVLCDIECIADGDYIGKLYDRLGVEHIIFYSKVYYDTKGLPISLINEPVRFPYFHTYGGGFLNEFWVEWYLSLAPSIIEFFGVGHYLLSGQQIDPKVIEKLEVFFDRYRPLLIGCRDEESFECSKKIAPLSSSYSFDDAFESIWDMARHIKPTRNDGLTQTILLHFNLTGYVHSSTAKEMLEVYKDALKKIKEHFKEKKIEIILLIGFNDSRLTTVQDTPFVLQAMEDSFDFDNVKIINLANIAFSYQPNSLSGYIFEIPQNSILITSSYHTAMLGLTLKIPTFLFSQNAYYAQKHNGLHIKEKDINDFLENLSKTRWNGEGLSYFENARKEWNSKLKEAYLIKPEPRVCIKRYFAEPLKTKFVFKFEKHDLQALLQKTHEHIRNLEDLIAAKDKELQIKEDYGRNLEISFSKIDSGINKSLWRPKGEVMKDNMDNPLVSVIIPTYNRPEMLKETLMSVFSQTYQNFEIIVVNDAGEDVKDVIDSLNSEGKIIYLQHKENKGPPAARNTGLKAARGKYIAYLDDDDIYYSNHLETLVGFLESAHYRAAYTDSYHAFQEWITDRHVTVAKKIIYSHDFDRKKLIISNYFPIINVVHRKDILEEVGLFDETLAAHEDWDLWIRISQQCDFYHIKKVTAEVRMRSDGTTMTSRNRMPFLKTLQAIYSRYSHLVTDSNILEAQKKVEEALTREVEIRQMSSSITQYEHLHRYRFVSEYVKDKKVLDLAFVDGYGDLMLAEEADEVIGMNSDEVVLRHASSNYIKENLEFIKGSITDVPIKEEKIFDLIVCFEALEQIEEHNELMKEVKRLLKDDGIFIVSAPNKYISSEQADYQKPLPLKELSFDDFKSLLNKNFKNTFFYGQKVYPSSNIFPLFRGSVTTGDYAIEKSDKAFLFVPPERKEARYLIAVSSDGQIKDITGNSYLVDVSETLFKLKDNQIRNLETAIRDKDAHIGNLGAAIRDKDTNIGNLEHQREENHRDWQAHEKNLKTIIETRETHIENLNHALLDKEQHIKNLEHILQDKETHIGNLERQREENYKDWQAHEENLRAIIEEKQTHIGNLEAALRDKESHISNLEATVRDKDTHIGNLERQREENYRDWQAHTRNLELIIKDKDANIGNLETILREKEVHLGIFQTAIKDKDAHIGNLEAALRDKESHISNLEAALREKETHIGNLERQREENYRDWQAHEKNLRAIIEDKGTYIGNLETMVRDKDVHIGNLEAAIRDKDTHIGNLETMVRDKGVHIGNLEAALRDKESHISNLEATVRDKDTHVTNLEAAIREREGTLNRIYDSHGWKALLVYYKFRNRMLLIGSKRRTIAKILLILFR